MTEPMQTIFVVDDDQSFLVSIERLLRGSGYRAECFSSPEDFLARCGPRDRGCVLLDVNMPGTDGLALQAAVARSANPLPVVFLTGHGDIVSSVAALRQGAEDYLAKTAPKELVIAAIERALARDVCDHTARTRQQHLQALFGELTLREKEVLRLVLEGRRNKQIAADLVINERSVKRHRTNLMRKLEVESVAELVKLAVEAGFVGPAEST